MTGRNRGHPGFKGIGVIPMGLGKGGRDGKSLPDHAAKASARRAAAANRREAAKGGGFLRRVWATAKPPVDG